MPAHLQKDITFHSARSKLVDAFARLESRLVRTLHRNGYPIKGDTLSSKLETLDAAAQKTCASSVQTAIKDLRSLGLERANIVHGEMVIVDIDGQRFASFRNARVSANESQSAALYSYKGICDLTSKLDQASQELVDLKIVPPSIVPASENVTSIFK